MSSALGVNGAVRQPGIIDCDSHIVESRDVWLRHIDPRDRDRGLAIVEQPRETVDSSFRYSVTLCGADLFEVAGFAPVGSRAIHGMSERIRRSPNSIVEYLGLGELWRSLFPYEELLPVEAFQPAKRVEW